jgi:hypothetical protein
MIIKSNTYQAVQSVSSLQGLYDGLVIAVDDGKESDEVFKELSHFPNVHLYRQHWDTFKSFGKARQDVLDRVPVCDYLGRSDGDELLASDPIEFRKWLQITRPEAVRGVTHYVYDSGWCKAGDTLRTDGIRLWKYGTRAWKRPAHEYPYPIVGEDNWIDGDILFNHINKESPGSKMDFIVALMQQEIDAGNLEYMWYQAREYVVGGQVDKAISLCFDYLMLGLRDEEIFNLALWGMVSLSREQKDYKGLLKKLHIINLIVKENAKIIEYLEMTYLLLSNET